ncbi:MAG: hypothetical protein KY455_09085 [Euryarchaeota archaeon]|nr:hypothetical protein [Euryarchaeota archaeon]
MNRKIALAVLILTVLSVVSAPVDAEDQNIVDEPTCVKTATDPPSVVVDYGCIDELPDFPPVP